jgi:hypothetical protein
MDAERERVAGLAAGDTVTLGFRSVLVLSAGRR